MTATVVDASAVAGWFVPGQATAASERLLDQAPTLKFLAPHLFPAECRNLLLKAQRRGTMTAGEVDTALSLLQAMDLRVSPLPDGAGHDRAMHLARREGLSFYDALYLKVALEEAAALASRDGPLLMAAERCGLTAIDLRK